MKNQLKFEIIKYRCRRITLLLYVFMFLHFRVSFFLADVLESRIVGQRTRSRNVGRSLGEVVFLSFDQDCIPGRFLSCVIALTNNNLQTSLVASESTLHAYWLTIHVHCYPLLYHVVR
jgi:hypothetical protein